MGVARNTGVGASNSVCFTSRLGRSSGCPIFVSNGRTLARVAGAGTGGNAVLLVGSDFSRDLTPFLTRGCDGIILISLHCCGRDISSLIAACGPRRIIILCKVSGLTASASVM